MDTFVRLTKSPVVAPDRLANPGNVGHLFVKRSFIDGALPLEVRHMPE
jgi:hypothetical protein